MDTYFEIFIVYDLKTDMIVNVLDFAHFSQFFDSDLFDYQYCVVCLMRERDNVVVRRNVIYNFDDYSQLVASRDYLEKVYF